MSENAVDGEHLRATSAHSDDDDEARQSGSSESLDSVVERILENAAIDSQRQRLAKRRRQGRDTARCGQLLAEKHDGDGLNRVQQGIERRAATTLSGEPRHSQQLPAETETQHRQQNADRTLPGNGLQQHQQIQQKQEERGRMEKTLEDLFEEAVESLRDDVEYLTDTAATPPPSRRRRRLRSAENWEKQILESELHAECRHYRLQTYVDCDASHVGLGYAVVQQRDKRETPQHHTESEPQRHEVPGDVAYLQRTVIKATSDARQPGHGAGGDGDDLGLEVELAANQCQRTSVSSWDSVSVDSLVVCDVEDHQTVQAAAALYSSSTGGDDQRQISSEFVEKLQRLQETWQQAYSGTAATATTATTATTTEDTAVATAGGGGGGSSSAGDVDDEPCQMNSEFVDELRQVEDTWQPTTSGTGATATGAAVVAAAANGDGGDESDVVWLPMSADSDDHPQQDAISRDSITASPPNLQTTDVTLATPDSQPDVDLMTSEVVADSSEIFSDSMTSQEIVIKIKQPRGPRRGSRDSAGRPLRVPPAVPFRELRLRREITLNDDDDEVQLMNSTSGIVGGAVRDGDDVTDGNSYPSDDADVQLTKSTSGIVSGDVIKRKLKPTDVDVTLSTTGDTVSLSAERLLSGNDLTVAAEVDYNKTSSSRSVELVPECHGTTVTSQLVEVRRSEATRVVRLPGTPSSRLAYTTPTLLQTVEVIRRALLGVKPSRRVAVTCEAVESVTRRGDQSAPVVQNIFVDCLTPSHGRDTAADNDSHPHKALVAS